MIQPAYIKMKNTSRYSRNREQGFTLVECMIVVAIIAIASAIAFPNIMNWLPNMRLKAEARDLYSNLQQAKKEAIQRNSCVSITFTTVVYPATGGSYTGFIDDGSGVGGIPCNGVQEVGELLLTNLTSPINSPSISLVAAGNVGGPNTVCFNAKSMVCGSQSGNIDMRNNQARWYRVGVRAAGVVQLGTSNDGVTWVF